MPNKKQSFHLSLSLCIWQCLLHLSFCDQVLNLACFEVSVPLKLAQVRTFFLCGTNTPFSMPVHLGDPFSCQWPIRHHEFCCHEEQYPIPLLLLLYDYVTISEFSRSHGSFPGGFKALIYNLYVHVEVRGQLSRVGFLLPPCKSQVQTQVVPFRGKHLLLLGRLFCCPGVTFGGTITIIA